MQTLFNRSIYIYIRLKPDNSNSHEFELHRTSNKATKLLFKVIKAIIIIMYIYIYTYIYMYRGGDTNDFMHALPIQITQEKEKVVVLVWREEGG